MTTIYLDMDGVVADFDAAVQAILGRDSRVDQRYPESEWSKLRTHQRIYRDLPRCADADVLVAGVQRLVHRHNLTLRFLTAVPKDNDFPWAFADKLTWANRHFPGIPVWFGPYSEDKQVRAQPDDILIDDRVSNITQWRDRGGYAILYTGQAQPVLDELSLLF